MSNKKKRVLILSTGAGSGHKAAGLALEKVFAASPEVERVEHHDALDFTNKVFSDFYSKLFDELCKNAPHFLGWWYDNVDEPWKSDTVRLEFDKLNTRPLVQFIQEYQPDITVCTHFMPAGVISHLILEEELDVHLSIVTTDLDFHSMWLSRAFHRYFVALDSTKHHLLALGLPEERITVSGIPTNPDFLAPVDREAVLAKYNLRGDLPILLVSAGAIGGGPVKMVAQRLLKVHPPFQAIFICGKNDKLRQEMQEFADQHGPHFSTLGFTEDMANLMKIATLFIGKPGGLTVAETTAVGLPMVIGDPIPGQEERNSDQMLEAGAAIKINDVTVLDYKLNQLLADPERLERMREASRRMGRPHAAETIVNTLLSDTLPPLQISKEEQKRMAKAIKEGGMTEETIAG